LVGEEAELAELEELGEFAPQEIRVEGGGAEAFDGADAGARVITAILRASLEAVVSEEDFEADERIAESEEEIGGGGDPLEGVEYGVLELLRAVAFGDELDLSELVLRQMGR